MGPRGAGLVTSRSIQQENLMTTKVRVGIAGAVLAAMTSLIYLSPSYAGEEKEIRAAIIKIADAIKAGDKDKAKSLASAIAKKIPDDGIDTVMFNFKTRAKGGLGWGEKALAN